MRGTAGHEEHTAENELPPTHTKAPDSGVPKAKCRCWSPSLPNYLVAETIDSYSETFRPSSTH